MFPLSRIIPKERVWFVLTDRVIHNKSRLMFGFLSCLECGVWSLVLFECNGLSKYQVDELLIGYNFSTSHRKEYT